jgi:outer membrane protein assembly factor BamD
VASLRSRLLALPVVALIAALVGCATTRSPVELGEVPSAEELFAQGSAILENGSRFLFIDTTRYGKAIETFQDIIDNYPYSDYAVLAELRIADAFYDQGSWEEALTYYRDFAELHPDHERVPYTIYRAALCHYNQSRDAKRDQTASRQALQYLDQVITRHPHAPEAAEAEVLWKELRTRLGRHVMGIADFYLARDEFQSAADRYRSVLNEYPGLGLDAEALYKLGVSYRKMNLDDEANRIFQVILENYQGSDIAQAAQDWIPAAH